MSTSRLLHNPRCSKSRAALALLQERGIDFEVVPYLEQPLGLEDLRALVAQGIAARDLLRKGEPEYDALDLDDPALRDDDLLGAVAAHPRMMERPVFVHGGRAIIGRPPERILELLD